MPSRPAPLPHLHRDIVACRACPRLVAWRERVGREKVARFRNETYWARPVPGFGDPSARILIVGLAPAAHGANRTGRIFTGDRSGDFLFEALNRAGLANQATSRHRDDGLALRDVYIVATVRCAPPDNAPLPEEIDRCTAFLDAEIAALPHARVILALGGIAWKASLDHLGRCGTSLPRPRPAFGHGARFAIPRVAGARGPAVLLGSYHVSQQNTQTGKLTHEMFAEVLAAAAMAAFTRS